ncbi:hypothetical protein Moror_5298 [Moniliophthora roreri MCA 2997]|uniref:Uncharacterized protein n=1 Tax=Moniliophthora roreri (strain MCA 2997) TaxID=1381753 RepID=V2X9K6_MONRO|nr:hypothetical protein Moror_5298 [Moniliophthora roreri MCA 2997]
MAAVTKSIWSRTAFDESHHRKVSQRRHDSSGFPWLSTLNGIEFRVVQEFGWGMSTDTHRPDGFHSVKGVFPRKPTQAVTLV